MSESVEVEIQLPPKLIPVFTIEGVMYRCAYGGRGSAKSRSFAKMSAVFGLRFAQANKPGVIVCGREFMNSLSDSSMAEVKQAITEEPWLAERYEIGERFIRTRDRRIEFAFCGLRHNLDSIKSKSRIRLLWVDEGESVSEAAWQKVVPTVREEGSEIWVTWNPERKESATNKRFRLTPPNGAMVVELNWRDNPWFPETLNRTRLEDLEKRPEHYPHIWEGDYVSVVEGAYFSKQLLECKADGRIASLSIDPLMSIYAHWDIGGTGAKADACSIWISQFIGGEIRILDYYEAQGQPLATHIAWLRAKGYDKANCILPHDGVAGDKVHDVSYESALRAAGFEVRVVPNQGAGAAKLRIEAARQRFPRIWFDERRTEPGRKALGWYHEKIDKERSIGLGPDHDWSSHGADAFGLLCIDYREPTSTPAADYSSLAISEWG